ncbi:hypothetical protein HS088_TW17G00296 [Tripterygium wilfordii]|uniref:Uncharacterized protein n=1 Tax=Tripterygium wilfordii TaxID=458696 RepID=A0A7J7CG19_TRIWF|nr:liprin-alpha-4 [Tripterygium wilfordii]KAF5732766.1 hypothetical protein HS088_TW17G00296 [Tripterygium wilfordii]
MAASVETPSPASLNKESASFMASSPLFSPGSDKRFWSNLRGRIDELLEDRHRKLPASEDRLNLDHSLTAKINEEKSERMRKMKEDSKLLLRGFDSVSQTLSQLSNNLDNALQGARDLAKPPTMTEIFHINLKSLESKQEGLPEREEIAEDEKTGRKRKLDDSSEDQADDSQKENEQNPRDKKLKKAKNIAISMATKAATLARELKSIKSDFCFMQERCALLEEENRRLRDGFVKGIRPEEDDLVRLQLEALLAEKSRLANENANLTRENQCLHQLVEYHQLTSEDLSASYENVIRGMCLDFSSPQQTVAEDADGDVDTEAAGTPRSNVFDFSTSLDNCFDNEK